MYYVEEFLAEIEEYKNKDSGFKMKGVQGFYQCDENSFLYQRLKDVKIKFRINCHQKDLLALLNKQNSCWGDPNLYEKQIREVLVALGPD